MAVGAMSWHVMACHGACVRACVRAYVRTCVPCARTYGGRSIFVVEGGTPYAPTTSITSHHITSCRIASHRITSHRVASHRITSHHIASHRITAHRITSKRLQVVLASWRYCGSCVVLPDPVSPTTIKTWLSRTAARNSCVCCRHGGEAGVVGPGGHTPAAAAAAATVTPLSRR